MSNIRKIDGHTIELRAGFSGFSVELNGMQIFWDEDERVAHQFYLGIGAALSNKYELEA